MRPVSIYDSLSREVRPFRPLQPPRVGLFVCGLTPWAPAHIGHGRTAVTFDVVARALRRWGYRVFYVQNVTNLDDRLIEQGRATGTSPLELAERHFATYLVSMGKLGVRSVNLYPFATDYLREIVEQVETLVAKGFAYPSQGSAYYDVAKFPSYGALSGQDLEKLRAGTRLDADPAKRQPHDFVLWKATSPGEPSWPSPWGPGRPGWHIEDTAITVRLLGPRYDIHGGGVDLKFPHHEAEIAQAEAATGEAPLVNVWMHAGMLQLGGEKMSKSVGNVVALDETVDRYGGEIVRFFYLNAVYRSPLDFVPGKSLEEARAAYERLAEPYRRLTEALDQGGRDRAGRELPEAVARAATELPERLDTTLAQDFQTREAIALLFGWARALQEWLPKLDALSGAAIAELAAPFRWATEALGLFERSPREDVPMEIESLVRVALGARTRARTRGDFAEADRIRDELRRAGIRLEDQGGATAWKVERGRA